MKISEPVKRSREVSLNMGNPRNPNKNQDKKPKISDVDKEKEDTCGGGSDKKERVSCIFFCFYESQHVAQLALELSSANEAKET